MVELIRTFENRLSTSNDAIKPLNSSEMGFRKIVCTIEAKSDRAAVYIVYKLRQ